MASARSMAWLLLAGGVCLAQEFAAPDVRLPKGAKHPVVACSADELARLRNAFQSRRPEHDLVAGIVKRADAIIAQPIVFPPRGGQHNQWYQCDHCEIGLKTIDDTHHQCPLCKRVYSGEPYDDVIFARKHHQNLGNMNTAAWAYAITGETKYAEFAAKVLLGYADRYLAYPYHANTKWNLVWYLASGGRLFEQTLTEASSLVREIAPAYDLIQDSGALSQADHAKIRGKLLLPMLKNIEKNPLEKGNWQSWHNAAMFWGGAVLGDDSWMRKSVLDPSYGFLFQMRTCVSCEGMWYENSWGYHFYALQALTALADAARRVDIDLWRHPALKKMFLLPPRYTMADGSLPRFADDVRSFAGQSPQIMEAAYQAYGDPAMLPLLPSKPLWETVLYGRDVKPHDGVVALKSEVFTGAGHAILRTRGEAGLSAAFTFGPYGGYHGHYDKLSLVFFGLKKELGVDPGRARSQAYRLPIHEKWYRATLGHNAVLVDRKSQDPTTGRLEFFAATEECVAALASCASAYPGVTQRRLLFMSPTYLLVFDELSATTEKCFDWIYHNRGAVVQCDAAKNDADLVRIGRGFEYIAHSKTGNAEGPVHARFLDDSVETHVVADGAPGTGVTIGDGPGESVTDRVPLLMISRKGQRARFAVVIEPVRKGAAPKVSSVFCDVKNGTTSITICRGAGKDRVTLPPGNDLMVMSDGKVVLRKE